MTQLGNIHQSGSPCPTHEWMLCHCITFFWPTLFNIQQSRFIPLHFTHCILSRASLIFWLIAVTMSTERNQENLWWYLLVTPSSYWWHHCIFGQHVPWPISGSHIQRSLPSPIWRAFPSWTHWCSSWFHVISIMLTALQQGLKNRSILQGLFSSHWQGWVPTLCHSLSTGIFDPEGQCFRPLISVSRQTAFTGTLITLWLHDTLSLACIQGNFSSHSYPLIARVRSIGTFAASLALPNSYLNRLHWSRPLNIEHAYS